MHHSQFCCRVAVATVLSLSGMTCFPALAAEPPLAFRGIALGDTVQVVQRRAASEFAKVNGLPPNFDITLVEASDEIGASRDCPLRSADPARVNCLRAQFFFETVRGQKALGIIRVAQSFYPTIAMNALVDRLRETYGMERRKYEKDDMVPSHYEDSADIGLVWGGRIVPSAPFRPRTEFLYPDYENIGGKYVTAVIYTFGGKATGYQLQIVDADRMAEVGREIREKNEHEKVDQERKSGGSLRF